MYGKLVVAGIRGVEEPEPGIVEIALVLEDKSAAVLRMDLLTFLNLWAEIRPLASSADNLREDTGADAA